MAMVRWHFCCGWYLRFPRLKQTACGVKRIGPCMRDVCTVYLVILVPLPRMPGTLDRMTQLAPELLPVVSKLRRAMEEIRMVAMP